MLAIKQVQNIYFHEDRIKERYCQTSCSDIWPICPYYVDCTLFSERACFMKYHVLVTAINWSIVRTYKLRVIRVILSTVWCYCVTQAIQALMLTFFFSIFYITEHDRGKPLPQQITLQTKRTKLHVGSRMYFDLVLFYLFYLFHYLFRYFIISLFHYFIIYLFIYSFIYLFIYFFILLFFLGGGIPSAWNLHTTIASKRR